MTTPGISFPSQSHMSQIRSRSVAQTEPVSDQLMYPQYHEQQPTDKTESAVPFWENLRATFSAATDFGSVVLENDGSVARDHLANERTYLSYLRTSLSFVTAGVTIVQFFRLTIDEGTPTYVHDFCKGLGCINVGIGITILISGVVRFFQIQTILPHGHIALSRVEIFVMVGFTFCTLVLSFILLFLVES